MTGNGTPGHPASSALSAPGIGDILAVRSPGFLPWAIRVIEAIEDLPATSNHVAVVHHTDPQGHLWVIAAQPGGVGYAQAAPLLASPYTLNNIGQPGRSPEARARVAQRAEAMLGTAYDWDAYPDALVRAFAPRARWLWDHTDDHGLAPAHVVCSSFAAYLYGTENWAHPTGVSAQSCQPGDWDSFLITNRYHVPLK